MTLPLSQHRMRLPQSYHQAGRWL
eukprot:COSAG05_NODE_929_length_6558_cov_3.005264_1_plen_23_part_10